MYLRHRKQVSTDVTHQLPIPFSHHICTYLLKLGLLGVNISLVWLMQIPQQKKRDVDMSEPHRTRNFSRTYSYLVHLLPSLNFRGPDRSHQIRLVITRPTVANGRPSPYQWSPLFLAACLMHAAYFNSYH